MKLINFQKFVILLRKTMATFFLKLEMLTRHQYGLTCPNWLRTKHGGWLVGWPVCLEACHLPRIFAPVCYWDEI